MPMEGALPNSFTINGKAYPAIETVEAKVSDAGCLDEAIGLFHPDLWGGGGHPILSASPRTHAVREASHA